MWLDPFASYTYWAMLIYLFMSGIISPKKVEDGSKQMLVCRYCSFSNEGGMFNIQPWFFHRKQLPSQTAVSIRLVFRTQILGPVKMHVLKVRCFFCKNRNKGSSKVGRVYSVFLYLPTRWASPKPVMNNMNIYIYKYGVVGPLWVGWNNPRNHIFFEAIYRGPICKTPLITIGGFWAHLANPEAWSFHGWHTSEVWHT